MPETKEIARSHYFWILYHSNEGYLLDVLCGRSAVYSVQFVLNTEESNQFQEKGKDYIDTLAYRVQNNPEAYRNRNKP